MLAEEYRRPEPLQPGRRWSEWFSTLKQGIGGIAFVLHRFTGIVLVLYLFLHFYVLSYLARGEEAYKNVVNLMTSPVLELLEVALVAAVVYHGLNGVRLVLMSLNIGVKRQKEMFWAVFVISALVTVVAAFFMLA